ncbi:pyridoxine/pyridoxamine 5'-phosphate oxidase [Georgenia yuyongxinii]|uniref:Pyridoxine 5'-phosphate oxidase n=1 Tax=Georgenia yuyongxinii TaxID=2589797 RepID=A0A552WX10_9MICO|nr:pyridoxamine 5'-phosphate oxidase family protein [Georgenia yuyongxinii]TRW47378.1 pyridoxine 5'-phosphate oxidase [Georgenia yuyongxinii]
MALVNPFGTDVDADDTPPPMTLARHWVGASGEGTLMTLTTVDEHGAPDARHVLLSDVTEQAFVFHTDARSRKTAQLEADPRVALALVWRDELRQLIVLGAVARTAEDRLDGAFARLPRYLQLLSWVNDDALAARPAADRRRAFEAFAEAHPGELTRPPWWVGYDVVPERLTFWRGEDGGPSNRLEYVLGAPGGWSARRLAG